MHCVLFHVEYSCFCSIFGIRNLWKYWEAMSEKWCLVFWLVLVLLPPLPFDLIVWVFRTGCESFT